MSKESAEKWVKFIHNDQKTGQQLLNIKDGDWDSYFKIVHEKGYDFDQNELHHAWHKEFGSVGISDSELDKVAGGVGDGEREYPPAGQSMPACGVRG